ETAFIGIQEEKSDDRTVYPARLYAKQRLVLRRALRIARIQYSRKGRWVFLDVSSPAEADEYRNALAKILGIPEDEIVMLIPGDAPGYVQPGDNIDNIINRQVGCPKVFIGNNILAKGVDVHINNLRGAYVISTYADKLLFKKMQLEGRFVRRPGETAVIVYLWSLENDIFGDYEDLYKTAIRNLKDKLASSGVNYLEGEEVEEIVRELQERIHKQEIFSRKQT
ncbi:MAG: hypothetical protein COX20_12870, partial [Desulfobacterales bacterium CG23_combo_of_CG06-09_8_20_14_all_52_9]